MRYPSLFFLLLAAVASVPGLVAQAADESGSVTGLSFPVSPHIDAYTKFGSDRRLTGVEAFAPLSWDGQVLSFTDLRFVGDDADGREFNVGLGLRRVSDDGSFILGGYGFFDRRRSSTGNLYTQITAGAEFLTESWEARANAYAPLTGEKTLFEATLPASLSLSGTGILATGGTATATETPLFGADFEVGHKLDILKETWFSDTWAYAGAYRFDAADTRAMSGARFRVETAPFEWLRLGAEAQQDNIRGETGFVEARIRVPLDFWRGTRHGPARPEGILKRLDARIARDVDVVTQAEETADTRTVPVLNAATGAAQKVYVVDNAAAAGGDGSAEHPFTTLAAAQAAAGAHEIIYVRRGDGTSAGMNAGIVLDDAGQRLIGSGVALDFDADIMRAPGIPGLADGTVIVPATVNPVVTNTAGNGVYITGNAVEVAGLTVSAATDNGIYAYNADDVTIRDVTASGSTNDGIRIEASGAGVSATGIAIEDAAASGNRNGIRLYAQTNASLAAKVEGSAATGNTQHGVIVYDDSTAGAVDADLGGGSQGSAGLNAITGNTLEDLALDTDGAALFAENNWWGQAGGPTATEIYDGAPLDTGLVGNWTFDSDDMSGTTAYDRSGNGYNGTMYGGMTASGNAVAGAVGGALNFDGVNDAIQTGNIDLTSTNVVTVSMWRNISVFTNGTGVDFEFGNNYNVSSLGFVTSLDDGTSCAGKVAASIRGNSGYNKACYARPATGTWVHIVYVFDKGRASPEEDVYYNGALQTRINQFDTNNNTNNYGNLSFNIMSRNNSSLYARDKIDDVRIYNRALSASEIAELYRMDTTGTVTTTGALSSAPP